MAIAKIQSVTAAKAGGSGTTLTLTPSATAGGSLLVIAFTFGYSSSVISCTDDKSNIWSALKASANSSVTGAKTGFLYAWNATAGVTSITITCNNTDMQQARFYEFSGVLTSSDPLDNEQAINAGVGATPTESNPTTLQAGSNSLFIAQVRISSANFTGVGSPFTYDPVAIQTYQGIAYLISSDSSSHTPDWANPSLQTVTESGISFKANNSTAWTQTINESLSLSESESVGYKKGLTIADQISVNDLIIMD